MTKTKVTINDLPPKIRAMVRRQERAVQGYWSTAEIAAVRKVKVGTIATYVCRGMLQPIKRVHGQMHLFADEEVYRYLLSVGKVGKPRKRTMP